MSQRKIAVSALWFRLFQLRAESKDFDVDESVSLTALVRSAVVSLEEFIPQTF